MSLFYVTLQGKIYYFEKYDKVKSNIIEWMKNIDKNKENEESKRIIHSLFHNCVGLFPKLIKGRCLGRTFQPIQPLNVK